MIYIYIYENLINSKVYIGQTNDVSMRDRIHARNGDKSMPIDNAIKKYGRDNFSLNIITSSDIQEIADEDEVYWIFRARELLGKENVYNIQNGGLKSHRTVSEETKSKISATSKIKWEIMTKEDKSTHGLMLFRARKHNSTLHNQNISAAHIGMKYNDNFKAKARARQIGKKLSEETKQKMKEAQKARWANKTAEERKQNVSAALNKRGLIK